MPSVLGQSETIHDLGEGLCLLLEALCRRRRLFHQRRVLLGHLIQLSHGLIHLANAVRLLLGCARDFADDLRHMLHAIHF